MLEWQKVKTSVQMAIHVFLSFEMVTGALYTRRQQVELKLCAVWPKGSIVWPGILVPHLLIPKLQEIQTYLWHFNI